MQDLHSIAGITKQALLKYRQRKQHQEVVSEIVVDCCTAIRKNHKRMSCRKMYIMAKSLVPIGRDLFEQIGFSNGFQVKVKRNIHKTTWSQKIEVYPNLLEGLILNNINQAWQSDIFYLPVEGITHYGVSIIDVYSRYLLALHLSRSLQAVETSKALLRAIKQRQNQSIAGCIFHSDRGSQYISDEIKQVLSQHKLLPSMCQLAQENAYVERVQGTLKYEYFFEQKLTQSNLSAQSERIRYLYNNERPHLELGMKTPFEFEQVINKTPKSKRMQLHVYQWTHPLLTKTDVFNKKEKSSKKEKSYSSNINH